MKYEKSTNGEVTLFTIQESRLVFESIEPTQGEITSLVEEGAVNVLMDLSKVAYMDSFAVGFVMEVYRRATNGGGKLVLTGLQPRVEKIFFITRVNNVVQISESVETGLATFRQ